MKTRGAGVAVPRYARIALSIVLLYGGWLVAPRSSAVVFFAVMGLLAGLAVLTLPKADRPYFLVALVLVTGGTAAANWLLP